MSQRRSLRGLPVFSAAIAGALGGHLIAYALAFDEDGHRHDVLASTGHGYLPVAVQLSTVLLLAATGAILLRHLDLRHLDLRHLDAGRIVGVTRATDPVGLTLRLWAMQVVQFVSMELAERLATGAPLSGLLREDLLAIAVFAQLLLAAIGAGVLLLMHRAAAGLAAVILRPPVARPARQAGTFPVETHRPATPRLAGTGGLRGPPS